MDGRLQGIANGRAIGWAWDARDPSRKVEVAIEANGEIVARGTADVARDELVAEGIGDGSHGFALDLTPALQNCSHVRLVALADVEQILLPQSPSFWQSSDPGGTWSAVLFSPGRETDPQSGFAPRVETTPTPKRSASPAVVGLDGWLFDADEFSAAEPGDENLIPRVLLELGSIARSLSEIDVAYVPALVPAKHEFLAESAPASSHTWGLWRDRLRAELRDVDDLELLDLLPVLLDARRHGPCYQRTDRGLNARGAFFVARALIKEASKRAPALRPLPLDRLHLVVRNRYRGDLADAQKLVTDGYILRPASVAVSDEAGIEVDVARLRSDRRPVDEHLLEDGVHVRLYAAGDDVAGPRLAVVGGELCLGLLPWLCESAVRTAFFWATLPPMVPIELELPDVVIQLFGVAEMVALGRR